MISPGKHCAKRRDRCRFGERAVQLDELRLDGVHDDLPGRLYVYNLRKECPTQGKAPKKRNAALKLETSVETVRLKLRLKLETDP